MTLFVVDSQNVFGKSVGEAGSYNVKILSDSEYKRTKEQQKDMAVLNYEVVDGKYAGGKVLYDNMVWENDNVELSVKRFNTVLAAIGVPDGTKIESIQQLVQALKGKQLNITVDWEQSDFNGRWNLKVKGYHKIDQEGSKPNGVERPSEHHILRIILFKIRYQELIPLLQRKALLTAGSILQTTIYHFNPREFFSLLTINRKEVAFWTTSDRLMPSKIGLNITSLALVPNCFGISSWQ